MVKINWTTTALNDVREIINFIAKDSPVYAERVGISLIVSVRRLEQFPYSGRIVPEFSDESIREIILSSYRIIYTLRKNNCYVVSVIHANRDLLRHIEPGTWDIPY